MFSSIHQTDFWWPSDLLSLLGILGSSIFCWPIDGLGLTLILSFFCTFAISHLILSLSFGVYHLHRLSCFAQALEPLHDHFLDSRECRQMNFLVSVFVHLVFHCFFGLS